MKFSLIVPVYNVYPYLDTCLESIFKSTYQNFEVIIINDGTQDKSEEIINSYLKKYKNIKYFKQENKGLSAARNLGIKKATGDYILFVDSDDYIEENLLETLHTFIDEEDVIRFQLREIKQENTTDILEEGFGKTNGKKAFSLLEKYKYIEMAQLYAIKREYMIKNKFLFTEGIYHEDFMLMPVLISKASTVKSLSFIGYNYVIHENSIMTDTTKTKAKMDDILFIFKTNTKRNISKELNHFYANSVMERYFSLEDNVKKIYQEKIKELNVQGYLDTSTLKRKIKKRIYTKKFR